jgi:preprotein translocase subunit SecG
LEIVPKEKIYKYLFKKNPELMAAVTGTGNSTMSEFATKSLSVGNPNMLVNLCLVLATLFFVSVAIVGVVMFFKHKDKIFAKWPSIKYYAYELKYMLMWSIVFRTLT